MVVVQVRSQMVSNDNVPGHSRFEKILLHVAREVRPQAAGCPLIAIAFGLRRPLWLGLCIADGLCQHLAKLGLGFRGFTCRFLPLGHAPYVGRPEGELNPQWSLPTPSEAHQATSCVWFEMAEAPTEAALLLPVNKLAVNLPPKRVDHGYLKVLIVAQALVSEVLGNFFAMPDRF
jgi:hypothetical protein